MSYSGLSQFKQFVKALFYKQFVVGSIVLFSGCSAPNRFSDSEIIQVYEARDQRNLELLVEFLGHPDKKIRTEAARAFASIPDSLLSYKLAPALVNEQDESVQLELAFSIGQTGGIVQTLPLLSEFNNFKSIEVKSELCVALAKCGHAQFIGQQLKKKEFPDEVLAEAAFYLARSGKLKDPKLLIPIFKLAENDNQIGFYAAYAILRSGMKLDGKVPEITKLISKTTNLEMRLALIQSLNRCDSTAIVPLNKLFDQAAGEENYLERLATIRAASRLEFSVSKSLLQKGLIDPNHHIRDQASIYVVEKPDFFDNAYLLKRFTVEDLALVKYRFAGMLLKKSDFLQKDSLSKLLKNSFHAETDEYKQGYILSALSGQFNNLSFLEEVSFSTPSILLREFAFSALLNYRKSPNFIQYSKDWLKVSPTTLTDHFAKLLQNAIETGDVSMVAISAEFLRDTALLNKYSAQMPVYYSSVEFMQQTLEKLILPRDIEAYGELLRTMRMYIGSPIEGNLKADYNNPIDWEYLQRIPNNQQIEFVTSSGSIIAELWVDDAPATVAWFMKLIEKDFYKLKRLHRVVPGFVIQDGCPRGDGFGSTMETIRSEFSRRSFDAGVLGMASAGPDTESCQWFITHNATPHLNGRYTAFGKVVQGMEVVHKLKIGDVIQEIKILP
jgi:cyclophilin family peptidyl-prolyl cis-trans isomerase